MSSAARWRAMMLATIGVARSRAASGKQFDVFAG